MSEDLSIDDILRMAIEGVNSESTDLSAVLSALEQSSNVVTAGSETVAFLKHLTLTETPTDPEQLKDLNKAEVRAATYRANFFERLRIPALDDEQLEQLYARAQELWGEHPTEPVGRWVEWCLWVHLHRRRSDGSLSELVFGDGSVEDLKRIWAERHEAREERRSRRKLDNYARCDTPEDVPDSVRHYFMSPLIEDDGMADIEIEESHTGPASRV